MIRRLAEYLLAATARGEISVYEPELAAHQFVALCRAELFYKVLFGLKHNIKEEKIRRIADATALVIDSNLMKIFTISHDFSFHHQSMML